MSSLNISLPEPMRRYVETQAEQDDFTPSEYIRSLIRADQEARRKRQHEVLSQLVALGVEQLDQGEGAELDVESLIRRVDARRAKPKKCRAKRNA